MSKKSPRDKASEEMMHYIRVIRCLEATGKAFLGYCITCERQYHISYLQAGHFISGRRNAVLFDIMCIYNQCRYCNVNLHGRHKKYRKIMIAKYGIKWVENRELRSKRAIPNNAIDFEKLRAGIKRMTEKVYRKNGYKTFSEILQS
jgi:hypothetical protein